MLGEPGQSKPVRCLTRLDAAVAAGSEYEMTAKRLRLQGGKKAVLDPGIATRFSSGLTFDMSGTQRQDAHGPE